MQLQVPKIAISFDEEEQIAMENRSKLRLVKSSVNPCTTNATMPAVVTTKTEMEKAFEWLVNEFKTKYGHYRCQRSIFGTVTVTVPVKEYKPEMIVAILTSNNVDLLSWKNVYHLSGIEGINEKRELVSVELTFDTPEIGVLNMPI